MTTTPAEAVDTTSENNFVPPAIRELLADPTRLRLLSLIATAHGEVCACEFVTTLRKSQPTISHHLKVLKDAGLITSKRRGKWQWYSVVPERLKQLRRTLS